MAEKAVGIERVLFNTAHKDNKRPTLDLLQSKKV